MREKGGVFVFRPCVPAQTGSRLGDVMSDIGAVCTATRPGEWREYRAARAQAKNRETPVDFHVACSAGKVYTLYKTVWRIANDGNDTRYAVQDT